MIDRGGASHDQDGAIVHGGSAFHEVRPAYHFVLSRSLLDEAASVDARSALGDDVPAFRERIGATTVVIGAYHGPRSPSGTARAASEDGDRGPRKPRAATVDDDARSVDAGGATQDEGEVAGKHDRRDREARIEGE